MGGYKKKFALNKKIDKLYCIYSHDIRCLMIVRDLKILRGPLFT